MGRARKRNEPVKAQGTRSRASAKKREEQIMAADERALRRYRIVQFAREVGGSIDAQWDAVKAAIKAGELPGPKPARATLHNWIRKAEKPGVGVSDFVERPRSGRPRKPLHPELEEFIELQLATKSDLSTRRLGQEVDAYAEREGLPLPGRHTVRRFVEERDPAFISALKHGSRAAILDTMVSGTIPTTHPHESWTLDEATLPIHVRVWDRHGHFWRIVKPDVVLIIDNHSRVIVGWYVVDPGRRGKEKGFHQDDVLAAIWSAALPELAPSSSRDFAGFLPQAIRWDRASVHSPLARKLAERGINIPELPAQFPKARGRVERPVNTLKPLCEDIRGYEGRWQVAEASTDDGRADRTTAAASRDRVTAKMVIAAPDLLTIEAFREEFDAKVIQRYNHEFEHSKLQTTPASRYFETLIEAGLRSGREILPTVDTKIVSITKDGLVHKGVDFAPEVDSRPFRLGERVEFRADPVLRGVYVHHRGNDVFVPTKADWARVNDPAEFAHAQRRLAREYSDYGHALREKYRFEILGPEGVARADEAQREALNRPKPPAEAEEQATPEQYEKKSGKKDGKKGKKAKKKAADASTASEDTGREPTLAEQLVARTGSGPTGFAARRGVIADPRQMIRLVK